MDIVSIFEEHRICKKLGLISQNHFKEVMLTCIKLTLTYYNGIGWKCRSIW